MKIRRVDRQLTTAWTIDSKMQTSMQLELTDQELQELEGILNQSLSGVREEVYKAEVADYKDALKRREQVLTSVLERIRALRVR